MISTISYCPLRLVKKPRLPVSKSPRQTLRAMISRKMTPIVTCVPWNPVIMKKVEPNWAAPQGLPFYLRGHFDAHYEAFPVDLDLEDLDRFMMAHSAEYEKRESRMGGVEITARGAAAAKLGEWLSLMFTSTVRVRVRV